MGGFALSVDINELIWIGNQITKYPILHRGRARAQCFDGFATRMKNFQNRFVDQWILFG